MVEATATGAVDFIQRGIFGQHLLCAANAATVFPDDENIDSHRQQREQVHQLELRLGFVLRPVVDQGVAIGDVGGLGH